MPNPYLPLWEYIPDGEPRVFGDRVYVYGSHDQAASDAFCDHKLLCWSASVDDLNHWTCHGHIFHTADDTDHKSDTSAWTDGYLFAPDVVEKDGKFYLYAYIMGAHGCVAVSDRPEGPFKLIDQYRHGEPTTPHEVGYGDGWFVDPGVLVDDDGRVYVYCGFERSFGVELNADTMVDTKDDTFVEDILPPGQKPEDFYEACSPRKIGDTYYLIYSPRRGSRLMYATADKPLGPYTIRGTIVDNGINYPAGNNHGSICKIKDQWYIFYHRMTNNTIMSRRGCVEKIEILPDGTIPEVEMTSLGFQESLNPYEITPAELACYLTGGCFVTENDAFTRSVVNITHGCVLGYKYFNFGEDFASRTMQLQVRTGGRGIYSKIHVHIDTPDGPEIGVLDIGLADGVYTADVAAVTGRHALFFTAESTAGGWFPEMFAGRELFTMKEFTFRKM